MTQTEGDDGSKLKLKFSSLSSSFENLQEKYKSLTEEFEVYLMTLDLCFKLMYNIYETWNGGLKGYYSLLYDSLTFCIALLVKIFIIDFKRWIVTTKNNVWYKEKKNHWIGKHYWGTTNTNFTFW